MTVSTISTCVHCETKANLTELTVDAVVIKICSLACLSKYMKANAYGQVAPSLKTKKLKHYPKIAPERTY